MRFPPHALWDIFRKYFLALAPSNRVSVVVTVFLPRSLLLSWLGLKPSCPTPNTALL